MTEPIRDLEEQRTPGKPGNPYIGTTKAPEGYYDTYQAADVLEVVRQTLSDYKASSQTRRRIRPQRGRDLGLAPRDAAAQNHLYWPVSEVWRERHRRIKMGKIKPMKNDPAFDYPTQWPLRG